METLTVKKYNLTYKPFGTTAILIEWPEHIDEFIIQDIISFEKLIAWEEQVADTIIAYNSLTVVYRNEFDYDATVNRFSDLYEHKKEGDSYKSKCWKIPVCYDVGFGLDLEELASAKQLSIDKVIELHTAQQYLVYFIGFQPGFLYLGGLNTQLHMPRKSNPRLRVAKGSVGIGGQQTGIYPQNSSGGWNILGKSPIDFFDITKQQPCFVKAGDRIKFESISKETFFQIEKEVQKGTYQLKFWES